jgi:hypothetical protein
MFSAVFGVLEDQSEERGIWFKGNFRALSGGQACYNISYNLEGETNIFWI